MEEGVSVKGGIRKEGRSWRRAFDGKEAMIFLGRTLSIGPGRNFVFGIDTVDRGC
jgi:hypothetical protein